MVEQVEIGCITEAETETVREEREEPQKDFISSLISDVEPIQDYFKRKKPQEKMRFKRDKSQDRIRKLVHNKTPAQFLFQEVESKSEPETCDKIDDKYYSPSVKPIENEPEIPPLPPLIFDKNDHLNKTKIY
jgi:hypothetical protein